VWATCFLNSPHLDLLEETQAFLTLKHLRCRKNSFQKLTQFSVRNNVLDATVSIVDHFCSRGTCVSSIQLSRTLWTKWPFSTLKCRICSQYSFKNYLNSQENNVPDSAGSNIDGFAWTDPRVFSTQLSRPIGRKQSVCPLRDTCDSFNRINRPKWPKHCMHIWKITKKKNRLIGQTGPWWGFLHHENCDLPEDILSKIYWIFTGTKRWLILRLLTEMVFIWEIHVFLQLSWIGPFETKWPVFQVQIVISGK
jgi:hypothetical protein